MEDEKFTKELLKLGERIEEQTIKMERENDELSYTGPDTTKAEENVKLKRDVDDLLLSVSTKLKTKLRDDLKPTADNLKDSESPLSTEEIGNIEGITSLLQYLKKVEKSICMGEAKVDCARKQYWQADENFQALAESVSKKNAPVERTSLEQFVQAEAQFEASLDSLREEGEKVERAWEQAAQTEATFGGLLEAVKPFLDALVIRLTKEKEVRLSEIAKEEAKMKDDTSQENPEVEADAPLEEGSSEILKKQAKIKGDIPQEKTEVEEDSPLERESSETLKEQAKMKGDIPQEKAEVEEDSPVEEEEIEDDVRLKEDIVRLKTLFAFADKVEDEEAADYIRLKALVTQADKVDEDSPSEEEDTGDDVRLKALFARGDQQIAENQSMISSIQALNIATSKLLDDRKA